MTLGKSLLVSGPQFLHLWEEALDRRMPEALPVLRGQRLVIKLGVGKMRSWGRGKGLESSWVGAVKGTSVQPQPQGSQTRQQNWDPPNQNQRGKAKSMSKERLGRKHVIRTNSQPALGSHWPCWREEAAIGAPLSHNPRPTRLARDSRVET